MNVTPTEFQDAAGVRDMKIPGSALLTDLYQLTMARAYHELGMQGTAVFELFVRRLPPGWRTHSCRLTTVSSPRCAIS